jgi:oxaloacetate decarboxylase gamma subunit
MSAFVSSGLTLMIFGMSTVFVFLILLIATTQLMSWVVTKFSPENTSPPLTQTPASQTADVHLLNVLAAAVKTYRTQQA